MPDDLGQLGDSRLSKGLHVALDACPGYDINNNVREFYGEWVVDHINTHEVGLVPRHPDKYENLEDQTVFVDLPLPPAHHFWIDADPVTDVSPAANRSFRLLAKTPVVIGDPEDQRRRPESNRWKVPLVSAPPDRKTEVYTWEREDGIYCDAVFSLDRVHRYVLTRRWKSTGGACAFVGLNPSTADEKTDDPTVRRCIRYAKDWGFGEMCMLNVFGFRATDPREMKRAADPVGPQNDSFIEAWLTGTTRVVACWGTHGDHLSRGRHVEVMLKGLCRDRLYTFGLTKWGHPKHPLYLRADLKPVRW